MIEPKYMVCKICGRTVAKGKHSGNKGKICNSCRKRYHQVKIKTLAIEYKGGKCEICGYDKNRNALEFHHLNPTEKEFDISPAFNKSWESIKPEIDKCILVCANCHREIHSQDHRQVTIEEYEKWINVVSKEEKEKRASNKKKAYEKRQQLIIENHKKIEERKQIIRNSNIDFSKFGWSKQLEPLVGIKSAPLVRWIKKHMPSFYKEKCYKIKSIGEEEIDIIIHLYQQEHLTIEMIAKQLEMDCARVSLVLHENSIDVTRYNARTIDMININSGQIIKTFTSVMEAAAYCEDNHLISKTQNPILKHTAAKISKCVNGRQKSAYGYKWAASKIQS